jgi:predicted GNAT family acetyltransferase
MLKKDSHTMTTIYEDTIMNKQNALAQMIQTTTLEMPLWSSEVTTSQLTEAHETEVLKFLAARPIHTVAMSGFIRDNGITSELNRGTFYGCRNRRGELEGVALIGHAVLIETRTDRALEAFANIAKNSKASHMIMGEAQRIEEFLSYYSDGGQQLRRACRELLFELRWPIEIREEVSGLRLGTVDDLDLVVPVHAQMAFEESGVNPLERDAAGFRERCARRLQQNRTYVWVENGELLFKADVISETPETIYIEGVWMNQEKGGKGYALRCLSQLARTLLARAASICLLTNIKNERARKLYERAGFKLRGVYDSIFLNSTSTAAPTN